MVEAQAEIGDARSAALEVASSRLFYATIRVCNIQNFGGLLARRFISFHTPRARQSCKKSRERLEPAIQVLR